MINYIKKIIKVFLGRSAIVEIAKPITFVGWRMATGTRVPWHDGGNNNLAKAFAKCDHELLEHIKKDKVILTQFRPKSVITELAQLRWRHYIVFWSASVASRIQGAQRNFVEMGVCDGLTAWYASYARQGLNCGGEFFLYDSWGGMRPDLLSDSERRSGGSYSYLNIKNTQKNLALCGRDNFVFNQGYIPESFNKSRNPDSVAWIHIDLNSSIPTIASLHYFWDHLLSGGLVLLDDFAWPGYEDTRIEVEKWCNNLKLDILQFPTGQALITKQ